ncbi:MAG: hypothetical protein CVT72_15280, partial [Alphaproteobacteria bacterium HGW-Alphaproteobacteria-11]
TIANEILAGAEDDHKELFVASQYSLMIAFPHMTGDEQLATLIDYPKVDNILYATCDLMQGASPKKYEVALEKAYVEGDTVNQFRLMAFAAYTNTGITDRAKAIIGELAASTAKLVRLCAFDAIRRLNDPCLLQRVVTSGWNANLLDSTNERHEIWFGSRVLVLAAAKGLISVAACIDRIDLGAYLNFVRALGSEAASAVTARIDIALKKAAGYDVKAALPEIEQRIGAGDRPDLFDVEDRSDPNESVRDSFKRMAEPSTAFYERQERNLNVVRKFEQEITSAGAQLIVHSVTPDLIAAIFAHAPGEVRRWHREFLAMNEEALRAIHNVALPVAQTTAAEDQIGAVLLFEKLTKLDPYVRITIGNARLSLDAVTIWNAGDGDELQNLRFSRLDSARNDAEIACEVLAAIKAGKAEQLRDYVLDRRSREEPAHIAKAIMVAGLCVETPWALETIDSHKDDSGFLSDAYDAAKYAMERHQWAKHWARMMRDAETATDLWRYFVLFATIVDGRFQQDEVKNGPKPELIGKFGATFNDPIRNRIKKWQGKREKTLFGRKAPDEMFLV